MIKVVISVANNNKIIILPGNATLRDALDLSGFAYGKCGIGLNGGGFHGTLSRVFRDKSLDEELREYVKWPSSIMPDILYVNLYRENE